MALQDATVRAAEPPSARFELYAEGGLLMIVKPSGGKLWRLKHRRVGNERQLTIGRYPDVGLKEARDVTILREAQGVTGAGRYVFHGQRAVALDA